MSGGRRMINVAGKYARDALKMLEDYCEFIEEQNLELLKENEKLRDETEKSKETIKKPNVTDWIDFIPEDVIKERQKHEIDTEYHLDYSYTFTAIGTDTQVVCKCAKCNWWTIGIIDD